MNWLKRLFRDPPAPTPHQLVAYAEDKTGDLGSRDDAVLALSASDLPEVERALLQMACDTSEDEMLIDQAGHALWIILDRQKRTPSQEVIAKMHPSAQKFFKQ
jgi:hypothetical protein